MTKKRGRTQVCSVKNGKGVCVKVGDSLYDSWGYDQTQNDFCRVVSISATGKTLMCDMVHGKVVKRGKGYITVAPSNNPIGCPPVRLHTRRWDGRMYFAGSYPFLSNIRRPEDCRDKRMGSFAKYTKPVYATAPGWGH